MESTTTEVTVQTASQTNWEVLREDLISFATTTAARLLGAIAVLIIGRLLIKLILRGLRWGRLSKKAEPTLARFVLNFTKVALNTLLIISVIAILGVPMSSAVALIASAGVAIGLALQGALSNLAGGVMILIFKPFRLDDFVEVVGHSGTVKDIGFFYTVLATTDNREVTIPNGTIMNSSVINVSAYGTRRVDLVFSVAYGSDLKKVQEIILGEAAHHELTLSDPEPFCRLSNQADSALEFTLRVWVNKDDYWQVYFDLIESVHQALGQAGIEIPFKQLDVHVTGNAPKA